MLMRSVFLVLIMMGLIGLTTMPLASQAQPFDLAAALAQAEPGATIVVPAGVYPGPLTIDKAVTLEGDDWPVIQGTLHGDVITVNAPDVTLRGLVIRGSGDSLDMRKCRRHWSGPPSHRGAKSAGRCALWDLPERSPQQHYSQQRYRCQAL